MSKSRKPYNRGVVYPRIMTIVLYGEARKPDIYYRCGWASDAKVFYVEEDNKRFLYVPGFEYAQAKQEVSKEIIVKKATGYKDLLSSIKGSVTVDFSFPHAFVKYFSGEVDVSQEVFAARKSKSSQEISLIADAQALAKQACKLIEKQLRQASIVNGVAVVDEEVLTSEHLKFLARSFLIQQGADCPELIVSSGSQTALPHHRGSGPVQEGPVIIDIFPQASNQYHGDLTRTIIVGECSRAEQMLGAVVEVHALCVEKCVAGQSIQELHAFAEEELAKRGFLTDEELTEGLIHSLGHGVGLAVHEAPGIGPRTEGVLKEGMVVTIEPGLYYDVGVRYEDIVVVGSQPRIL